MAELEGMVAVVTGAGGGIGAACAHALARRGAAVVVNDVRADAAEATVWQLRELGATAHPHPCDVADPAAAAELIEKTARAQGRVDVLVNNAGILGRSAVADMPDEEWHRVLAVNLDACFSTSRAAVAVMRRAAFGRIVNIASIAGIRISYAGSAAYTASKAGLIGLTRHLAVEVAPHGITVNAVLPGVTATALLEEESLDALASSIPLGRAASPEDHAAVVAFLAGRDAGYVTGAAIPVDGGLSLLPGDFASYVAKSAKTV
jgi:3-oxoacyl-[acyl-carrier protein] reductase